MLICIKTIIIEVNLVVLFIEKLFTQNPANSPMLFGLFICIVKLSFGVGWIFLNFLIMLDYRNASN